MQFAWFNSAGDFDYFSARLPLLVMSCKLRPTASDYWAFVKTSAHRQAVITSELEKHHKAHEAIFPSALLQRGARAARRSERRLKAIVVHLCLFTSPTCDSVIIPAGMINNKSVCRVNSQTRV